MTIEKRLNFIYNKKQRTRNCLGVFILTFEQIFNIVLASPKFTFKKYAIDTINLTNKNKMEEDHSRSTYAEVPEKLAFLTP